MNFIINFFKKIFNTHNAYDTIDDKKKIVKEDKMEAEIVYPERYKFLTTEEEEGRPLEDSVRVIEALFDSEKEKKDKAASKTRDPLVQEAIIKGGDEDMLCNLAMNPWLIESIQITMAEESSTKVRAVLARKNNLSLIAQKILAQSDEVAVRRMLAQWQRPLNPTVAKILVRDPEVEVRKIIASTFGEKIKVENIFCFRGNLDDVYDFLITDPSAEVRSALIQNKNLDEKTKLKLLEKCFKMKEWNSILDLLEYQSISKDTESKVVELTSQVWDSFMKKRILKKIENKNKSVK